MAKIIVSKKGIGMILILGILLFASFSTVVGASAFPVSPNSVLLGTAGNFSVLAYSAVTNTGPTTVTGDVGLSPTTGAAITGFPPGAVSGTIYTVDLFGPAGSVNDPGLLTVAKNDLNTAYNDAAGRPTTTTIPTELGGTTLGVGVYDSAAGTFGITGTLTLDGGNDPNAVFIFQMESTLITASYSVVRLINGAHVCNVFWQVGSSATIDTYSVFVGTILAYTSITVNTGATVDGRLLASNGAVTLEGNIIGQTVHLEGIVLAPASSTNPLGTQHTVTATVAGTGDPVVGRSVNFTVVSGPNAGLTSSSLTNSSGKATFTYTSSLPGTDTIEASFVNSQGVTVNSSQVTKTWASTSTGGLLVTKTGPASAAAGSTVTYDISVTTLDDSSVSSVSVTDSLGGTATYTGGDDGDNVLESGETWTYTVSYLIPVNAHDPLVNTATASGYVNGNLVSAFDEYSLDVLYSPVLLVTKTGPASAAVGTTATYSITVAHAPSSDGSDVSAVSVIDNVAGVAAYVSGDTNFDNKLNAGETWTYTVSYLIPVNAPNPLVNAATASGHDNAGNVVSAFDNHSLDVVIAGIAIEKQVWDGSKWVDADAAPGPNLASGCVVKFRVTVSNIGGVKLTGIVVTDPKYCGASPIVIGDLAVGASVVKEYTLVWSKGQQVNTATASGLYGGVSYSASDSAYYNGTVPVTSPAIDVEKYVSVDGGKTWFDADTAPGKKILAGRSVYYKFVVTNVGNVKLTGISLSDAPSLCFIGCIPSSLAPGAKFTVTAGPVKSKLLLNKDVATATGCYNGVKYIDTDNAYYYGTLTTYTPSGYAGCGTSGNLFTNNFAKSFSCGMEIGYYTASPGYGYKWTSVTSLKTFLKVSGTSGAILSDKLNPTSVSYGGGTLAVQTAALTVNVVFSGRSGTSMPAGFGSLHYVKSDDSLSGYTVNQILASANKALAGQGLPSGYTFSSLSDLVSNLNLGFNNSVPSSWAQTYLTV
ncbi:MAG: hypothetical protein QG670_1706 [Thermoproteota archaeon]|nr:hypothetical protein [Thermoproteota archaeon]